VIAALHMHSDHGIGPHLPGLRGQAVKRAPCTPGDTSQCMPGEACIGGVCVPQIQ